MQNRRSLRLNPPRDDSVNSSSPPVSTPPSHSRVSRKNSRKRPRRNSQSRSRSQATVPEIESLSEGNESDQVSEPSETETEIIDQEEDQDPAEVAQETFEEIELIPLNERYEASRATFLARAQETPALIQSSIRPISARFITTAAAQRFEALLLRKFLPQQSLDVTDENLANVRLVVAEAGLIYTVFDSMAFQPTVVREFIANLPDAEPRDDGVAVYVRGSMVVFSPSLLNAMFCIPGFEEDPSWREENIDRVCVFLTQGRVKRREDMSSKWLTATNQVLYKPVCSNWIPTTSYTAMNSERLRFLYMMYVSRGFDIGKLVYDQVVSMADNTEADKKRRIIFPNLIQQVLLYQRNIPPDKQDVDETGFQKHVVKDIKAGLGSGSVSRAPNLEEDIEELITDLKALRMRLRRGEYEGDGCRTSLIFIFDGFCVSSDVIIRPSMEVSWFYASKDSKVTGFVYTNLVAEVATFR
ncbi:uncharacterized protein LOC108820469 [Raphanus sativus]|uniref:Uncharacterized protein LOC108820469 n=1 Tax=Raphanus sativus TaxID=3726 RepID=A0A6J0KPE4_RAPSA|nr:uncharacterized protein LOC108820469 [Raphanus sativus]